MIRLARDIALHNQRPRFPDLRSPMGLAGQEEIKGAALALGLEASTCPVGC